MTKQFINPTPPKMLSPELKAEFREHPITRGGISWEQFFTIQRALADLPGMRLIYCERVLEIMPLSKTHEFICHFMGMLLGLYFLHKRIRFFPSGAYSQRIEGITEYQSDLSYSFDTDKDVPDLCIEVVITSGAMHKLRKYQLRGVPEVWFWQNHQIVVYRLVQGNYELQPQSLCLPDLDLGFLCVCIQQDDPLQASLLFRERYA